MKLHNSPYLTLNPKSSNLYAIIQSMFEVALPSAFIAGIITFLAPCTLPLLPAYLAFLAGSSKKDEKVLTQRAISFISGFSLIVILLGVFVSSIGRFVTSHRNTLIMIGGILFIFFGLSLLNIINVINKQISIPVKFKPNSNYSAFLFGVIFSFGWSPCVGPILGSIYVLASSYDSFIKGLMLLFAYVLGHGIPFVLFAYFYERASKMVKILSKYTEAINKTAGAVLLIIGLFMIFGKYGTFIQFFMNIFNGGWQDKLLNFL